MVACAAWGCEEHCLPCEDCMYVSKTGIEARRHLLHAHGRTLKTAGVPCAPAPLQEKRLQSLAGQAGDVVAHQETSLPTQENRRKFRRSVG